jgi:DNA mismatch repair ATPase MutL
MPASHVDVNLHPTKAEVAVLHQAAIIAGICGAVQDVLKGHDGIQCALSL